MLRMQTFKNLALGFLVALAAAVASHPAHSTVNVSQVPLLVSNSVDPNIMFIIDDSGSMFFEVTPDDLAFPGSQYAGFVFPRANNVYGPSDYAQTFIQVATVDDNNAYTAIARSPQFNTTYYNPALTYIPWVRADNTLYPNSAPSCAFHNPENTGACPTGSVNGVARNLTVNNTNYNGNSWRSCSSSGTCSSTTDSKTFWPATYYWHDGGNEWDWSNYTRVEIRPTTTEYSGHGRESRSDCTAGVCTYAQEIQNFANWYTYYRSRILASRAGIGRAFAQQSQNMRVGYGTINKAASTVDGTSTSTIVSGVRQFDTAGRAEFFNQLYTRDIPAAGTPLRRALDDAGQYFSRTDQRGPWSSTPGSLGGDFLECRQSYTILMTDGYWSGGTANQASTAAARENVDNSDGPSISGPDNPTYSYSPIGPFRDSHSNTLADIAMYYWNRDLAPGIANRVPTSQINPAFWQHMVTFGVGLGLSGSVDPDDAWAAIANQTDISWPNTNPGETNCTGSTCPARLDDLLHAAVNSRGGFFSAADPDTFARELGDVLVNITNRVGSAASVAANSTRLETGTRIYQARFNSGNWTGDLLSFALNQDGSVAGLQWNAASLIPNHAARNIVSFRPGAGGINFQWSAMSAAQQTALNAGDGLGQDRVDFLRGDAADEQRNGGPFRNRVSVLGDIVNSDPAFMGRQDYGFYNLPNATEADSYRDFLASKEGRPEVIFVGANDGMLHAFDANTGVERFAFVPNAVYQNLPSLTDPNYSHRFFVDGSPRLLDAYLPSRGGWRTILIGSTGAGGRSVFALDVTNPGTFGPSNVLWEFTHTELGVTVGQPSIARMPNGQWVAIFGNGYNSTSQTSQLFIVDLATGNLVRRIDTGVGGATQPNGLSSPVPVDISGDRVTTLVYAGDLRGNLWKFDVSHASNTGQWAVAFSSGGNPAPLFRAERPAGTPQPITVRPTVGRHPEGGQMVFFGTGKYFEVGDNFVPDNPPIQSFYGIRDNGSRVAGRNELVEQTIVLEGLADANVSFDYRIVSNNTVNYASATQKGWYLDLNYPATPAEGERVIGEALLRFGRIIFVSIIPSSDPCDYGGVSWLMELDAINGSRLDYAVFDVDGDGEITIDDILAINNGEEGHVSGRRINDVVTTPYVLDTGGDTEFKYMSGASGQITVVEEAAGGVNLGRQSWRQLR